MQEIQGRRNQMGKNSGEDKTCPAAGWILSRQQDVVWQCLQTATNTKVGDGAQGPTATALGELWWG